MQAYILTKTSYWKEGDKEFVHYWTNKGENFPDISDFDEYLNKFKDADGNNLYYWAEIDATRIFRGNDISECSIRISSDEIKEWHDVFLKIEDGSELPMYYYNTEITTVTNQNEPILNYKLILELDMWSTFGCMMHGLMKSEEMDEKFPTLRKMCDRFIFNSYIGYTLDYKLQPWLMRTAKYDYDLIKDNTEKSLALNEWLYINSGEQKYKTLEDWVINWYVWSQSPWSAVISTDGTGGASSILGDLNYIQNQSVGYITNGFNDADYNSNGKYKWFVLKTGNNSSSQLAKNPIFPRMGAISLKVGEGKTPFYTIPEYKDAKTPPTPSIEFNANENFIQPSDWYGYVIEKEYNIGHSITAPAGQKVTFNFSNVLFSSNYIQIYVLNKETKFYESVWIDNNLSNKLKDIQIDSFSYGVEYTICEFDTITIKYSNHIDLELTPTFSFSLSSDGKIKFYLRLYIVNNYLKYYSINDYQLILKNTFHTNEYKMYASNETWGDEGKEVDGGYNLSGEELMYIPIKKGKAGYDFIHKINSDSGESTTATDSNVILSKENVLGMPVNDIPPSVMAIALRNYANSSPEQPIGDILSARYSTLTPSYCPVALINFTSKYQGGTAYNTPAIINSLGYIPINIAINPQSFKSYNVIGGTNFWNSFYDLLTNQYLTDNIYDENGNLVYWYDMNGNKIEGGNTMYSEPLLYGPQFFQWVYLIDGQNKIILTPDMIDFDKFLSKDWSVRLNVSMTDNTHYKLDISDINSNIYPFTKIQAELISTDAITYPYGTEGFNEYLANHQYSVETSKNAKDIKNYWAQERFNVGKWLDFGSSIVGGTAAGASTGTWQGAAAGAGVGLISGIIGMDLGQKKLNTEIAEANEAWNNDVKGELGNYYSCPSSLNPSGFSSGSLLYSGVTKSKSEEYETFRTFIITDQDKKKIWQDIAMNGYNYDTECQYSDYLNRINFNIINMNLDAKAATVNKYLKSKMGEKTLIFSQQMFIDWFKAKCKSKIRLFDTILTDNVLDKLICTNIERDYVRPYIPLNGYVVCDYNLPKIDIDDELANEQLLNTDYSLQSVIGGYNLVKNTDKSTSYNISIPLSYFGYKYTDELKQDSGKWYISISAVDKLLGKVSGISGFDGLRLNNDMSATTLLDKDKEVIANMNINKPYSALLIDFDELTEDPTTHIYSSEETAYPVIEDGEESFSKLIVAYNPNKPEEYVRTSNYNNGWKVTVKIHPSVIDETAGTITKEAYIEITAKAYSLFKFVTDKDISTWPRAKSTTIYKDLTSWVFNFETDFNWDKDKSRPAYLAWWKAQDWPSEYYWHKGSAHSIWYHNVSQYKNTDIVNDSLHQGKHFDGVWKWNYTVQGSIVTPNGLLKDVTEGNWNEIKDYDNWIDVTDCDYSLEYFNKEYNHSVEFDYKDAVTCSTVISKLPGNDTDPEPLLEISDISKYRHEFDMNITLNKVVSLDKLAMEQIRAGTIPWISLGEYKCNVGNSYLVTIEAKDPKQHDPDHQPYGWGFTFKINWRLKYNKETDSLLLQYKVAAMGAEDNYDLGRGGSSRWFNFNRKESSEYWFKAKIVLGTEKTYWQQFNRLNSLIFPKTNLIDLNTSYIANKK